MTVTSNIHIGLAAWTSSTYALGNRVSTGGNAYQCTTAGSSTAAPTGTGSSINNGGVAVWKWLSAIDYTTLQAWATALPSTLLLAYVGLLWNDTQPTITTTVGSSVVSIFGHTTTSSNTITLKPAPGEGFTDTLAANPGTALAYNTANGVSVQLPASGAGFVIYFDIQDANVIIQGIQFQDPNSGSTAAIIGAESGASGCLITDCIIDGYSQASNPLFKVNISSGSFTLSNSLIIDRAPTSNSGQSVAWLSVVPTPVVVNCTFVAVNGSNTGAAIHFEFNTGVVSNCAIIGYTAASSINTNSATVNVDHSVSSAASFSDGGVTTGTGCVFNATAANQFVNSATNFRLKQGSDCINSGTTDTTYIPASNDIIGTPRPQFTAWDIGAYEFLGVAVTRDIAVGIATGSAPLRDIPAPTEWRAQIAVSVDTAFPIEWGTGAPFVRDMSVPIEWGRAIFRDDIMRMTLGSGVFEDGMAAVEINATAMRASLAAVDWKAAPLRDSGAPIEWRSALQRDSGGLLEIAQSMLLDNPANVTWGGMVSRNDTAPIEFGGGIQISSVTFPMEFLGSRSRDASSPIEWIVLGLFSSTSMFPVEWGGGVLLDAPVQIEPQGLLRADRVGPTEWGRGQQRDVTAPMATMSALYADVPVAIAPTALTLADSAAPLEWLSPFAASAAFPLEVLHSLLRDDASTVAAAGGVMVDQPMPASFGGGLGINYAAPVEWGGLFVANMVANVTWFSGVLLDTPVPLEFGHMTRIAQTDASVAIEFGAIVGRSDTAGGIEIGRGQRSIGSVLEPDEWEQEHEPPGLPEEPH